MKHYILIVLVHIHHMNFISEKGYPDYIIIGSYCYKLVKHDSKSLLLRDYDGDEIEILIKNDEFVYKLI